LAFLGSASGRVLTIRDNQAPGITVLVGAENARRSL
jgi:hypothetical protein